MRFSFTFFATALLVVGVSASNVLDLSPDNWDDVVGKGKAGLVEFYAPWCGHCKNLAPTYEQLGDAFAHASSRVYIAKIDADGVGREIGSKYDVKGFPTLKWFDDFGNAEAYEGGRDLDSLAAFITQKSGVKSNIKPPPPPATLILDSHTFDEVALDSNKNVLVSFTAPWCGHCKNLKPTYEKVANTFLPESDCVVANIDADAVPNKPLASKYGVKSYPTIKFFPANGEVEDYVGGRSEADFVQFLNEKCGTQRAVGGGLTNQAGRFPAFDELAAKFAAATADVRQAILKEASSLAEEYGSASKHYIKVMEKVINGTEGYFEKEGKRLESILKRGSLAPSKLDELKIKANILSAFVIDKAGEVRESVVKKVEAEL